MFLKLLVIDFGDFRETGSPPEHHLGRELCPTIFQHLLLENNLLRAPEFVTELQAHNVNISQGKQKTY